MPNSNSPPPNTSTDKFPSRELSSVITPEVVQKVAEMVFALLMADLKIEREREWFYTTNFRNNRGGRYGD
jgi:hypothetical protein